MSRVSQCQIVNPEWLKNKEKGLCPPCGKEKKDFAPLMRKYCSPKCRMDYRLTFLTWADMRSKILDRDNYICQKCFAKGGEQEVDHIVAVGLGADVFDEDNLQTLCIKCHRKKTIIDLNKIRNVKKGIGTLDIYFRKESKSDKEKT